jgi:splicing factor 3B subunit 1
MSPPGSPRLVDSYTVPKEILQEFHDLAEEDDADPFAETASKRQIAARQSDYHNRRFNRVAVDSADVFNQTDDGKDVEGGYKDAMRLTRLEQEEQRVRKTIEESRRKEREEDQMKMDLDKTPPREEIEAAERELMAMKESAGTKRKRRWDVEDTNDENIDPNKKDKEDAKAVDGAAPKKRRSRWDATPAETAAEPLKRSRWDQTPAPAPEVPLIRTTSTTAI